VAKTIALVWLGLLVWIGFFHGLGAMELLDETEPMFVESARQMYLSGDWLTPMFNGAPRFDKPPLVYWLMTIAFQWFGTQAWAAKLAAAIPASLVVVGLFGLLQWVRRHNPAIKPVIPYLGAAIVALNLQMWFFGRMGYSDMLLNLWISGGIGSFFVGYSQPHAPGRQTLWYLLLFGCLGGGMLTKGPVAVVLPGLIIGVFLLLSGQAIAVVRQEIPWGWGLGIFVAIALPWYWLIIQTHGSDFINAFFGFHNVQRFTQVINQHRGPWYYHLAILLPGMLPWSIALPAAIVQVLRQPFKGVPRAQQIGHLALIWWVVVIGFFTIASTKYVTYSLPAVPATAILITLWWNAALHGQAWGLRLTNYATIGLFFVMGLVSLNCPRWLNNDPSMPNLGQAIGRSGLPLIGAGLWLVGLGLGVLYVKQPAFWRVKLITAAAFILLFVTPAFGVVDQVRQLPLRQMGEAIRTDYRPFEAIAMATQSFGKPSVLFYSQHNLALMREAEEITPYIRSLRQQSPPPPSLLLLTTPQTLETARFAAADYEVVKQVGIYQLVRLPITPWIAPNRPPAANSGGT
jgi:4-amino-4-deoxy-L-arabinose transferase-like glycosyltransferase